MRFALLSILVAAAALLALALGPATVAMEKNPDLQSHKPESFPSVTLGGGCFWCTESEFRALDGVVFTRVGYMGGALESPKYGDITTGRTGHAEVTEVTYDPQKISYEELIRFFQTRAHDPTQLNRQGVDIGTQYRSVIFYQNEEEKNAALMVIADLEHKHHFKKPIVTTLEPADSFWLAEDDHQQYYEKYQEKTGAPHLRVLLKQQKKLEN